MLSDAYHTLEKLRKEISALAEKLEEERRLVAHYRETYERVATERDLAIKEARTLRNAAVAAEERAEKVEKELAAYKRELEDVGDTDAETWAHVERETAEKIAEFLDRLAEGEGMLMVRSRIKSIAWLIRYTPSKWREKQ